MGLIAWRWIARKTELSIFPDISPKWGGWSSWKPSQAREVVFENIKSRKPLYIAPYLLGGLGQVNDLDDTENFYEFSNDPTFEPGLDVKYGITGNLTLDVTLNTDFAQVEADDQQVNLTRFSLFFPEKRLFFQERSSVFDFSLGGPSRLFYSRRIGLFDEAPVRIFGGVRVVGRQGPWDIGFLNMQTAETSDVTSRNYGVLRLRRRVINANTYVGGILTSIVGLDGTYNTAYGLDGIFRFSEDQYLGLMWTQTFENDAKNNLLSLDPAKVRISLERRTIEGLGYNFSLSRSGEYFNPAMGFEMRKNYARFGNRISYGWLPGEQSKLFQFGFAIEGSITKNTVSNITESIEIGPAFEFQTKSFFTGNIKPKYYYENLPDTFSLSDDAEVPSGEYNYNGIEAMFMTPMSGMFFTMANLQVGSFYDGSRMTIDFTPQLNFASGIELSGFYQYNRIKFPDRGQDFVAHISRIKVLLMFNTKVSLSSFIQYNSAIDAVITNVRFRYNPREGNDFYIVYNEGINTDRYREFPNLPFTSERTILLKYTYTFNL